MQGKRSAALVRTPCKSLFAAQMLGKWGKRCEGRAAQTREGMGMIILVLIVHPCDIGLSGSGAERHGPVQESL
jgi:hypothetical protein